MHDKLTWPTPSFRGYVALLLLAIFGVIYLALDGMNFPLRDDENHFWPNSQIFAQSWLPSLHALRNYNELNTPLPFILFGWLEKLTGHGLPAGRLLNFLASLGLLLLLTWQATQRSDLWRALVGILSFPYFVATSVLLYTDILATFWIVMGCWSWQKNQSTLSALAFGLAISCRQFALAFPAALLLFEIGLAWQTRQFKARTPMMVAQVLALASIGPWIMLWGGLAPPNTAAGQGLPADFTLRRFTPENSLYFLTTLGAYFVVPEFILRCRQTYFPKQNWKVLWCALLLLGMIFFVYPPYGNVLDVPTMGLLDIAVRQLLSDVPRVLLFGLLAGLAVWRFWRWDVASLLVFCNVLLMLKSKVAWDKYLLPLLVVLWWLSATDKSGEARRDGL